MQHNSYFLGCNYSNRDITMDARTGYSMCPVQDIDSVLANRYGVSVNDDDAFSLLYCDLYLRQMKETLKHTMLVHESVFESQIHELHRLYRRQKELMMEMEETRQHGALYLNSSFPSARTHSMSSSVSSYQTRNFPYGEENIPNQIEAVDNVKKSEKMVLDLELPVFGCHDREEERSLMNGEVHEVANFLKEQSLESGRRLNKLQLDLNEPAKIEEHSDCLFSQFLSPVTSNEIREESDKKNEGEDSVKGSCWMNEALGCGFDLNLSPLSSEEEVKIVNRLETEKPQECLSEHSRVVVQPLPCLNNILLMNKPHMSYQPRKKVKLGPINKTYKGSDLDRHLSAQTTSESESGQAITGKGSSSSARNRTNLEKRRRCKPQMESGNGDKLVAKKKRKKSKRISLVTEGNYQEISAAEALVDMSRKSDRETSSFITSLSRYLLLLAEVSSLVVEGYELDYSEATTLQLTEMNLEEHKTMLRSNSADNKTAVSSIVLRKQRKRRAKRKCKDDQHDHNPSLDTFSKCEADEDLLQVIEKLVEAPDSKWEWEFPKHKSKSSPPKPREAFTFSVEGKTGVDWGAIKKRRRGSRIPAVDFQHMIINQVV